MREKKKTHIELAGQEIEVGRDTETERKICGSEKRSTNAFIVRVTERPSQ